MTATLSAEKSETVERIHLINADLFTCGIASIIQAVGSVAAGSGSASSCRCCRA